MCVEEAVTSATWLLQLQRALACGGALVTGDWAAGAAGPPKVEVGWWAVASTLLLLEIVHPRAASR